jgi:hypothetical protein
MGKTTGKKKTAKKKQTSKKRKFSPAKPDAEKQDVVPYPTAGARVEEFEKKLDQGLARTEPPKRGPGRPRKEDVEAHDAEVAVELLQNVIKTPFELWAISQDVPGLALSDAESQQWAEPMKQLLDYYLPKIPTIAYAWIAWTTTTFWIFRPRMILLAEIRKQKQKEAGSVTDQRQSAESKNATGAGTPRPAPPTIDSSQFPTAEQVKPQTLK